MFPLPYKPPAEVIPYKVLPEIINSPYGFCPVVELKLKKALNVPPLLDVLFPGLLQEKKESDRERTISISFFIGWVFCKVIVYGEDIPANMKRYANGIQ